MGPEPASAVLTAEQKAIAVAFRRHTLRPLDDGLYALQATIPQLSRPALHGYFQGYGISRRPLGEEGQSPPEEEIQRLFPRLLAHGRCRNPDGRSQAVLPKCLKRIFVAIDRTSQVAFAERRLRVKCMVAAKFLCRVLNKLPDKDDAAG